MRLVAPSVCRAGSPKSWGGGKGCLCAGTLIFTASSTAKSKGRPFERSPAPSLVVRPAEAVPRRQHSLFPPPRAPRQRAERQTSPQTKVDFSARFVPSPSEKAIWCFVYRESCHGELACKSSSTIGCIKLSNSCPKEPKKPQETFAAQPALPT